MISVITVAAGERIPRNKNTAEIFPKKVSARFATGLPKAMEFMAYFRKNLSSIATPVFAFDLPEGGGKVQLFPDCSAGDKRTFYSIDGRVVRHPLL